MKSQTKKVPNLQKNHVLNLRTGTVGERIELLQKLHDWVLSHREAIQTALYADLPLIRK